MNTHMTRRILGAFFAVMLLATAQSVHAGLFRAYLSVNGNDANPCSVAAPCRLLPAALAAVNDGGEIWMLDSANFNTGTVLVSKSVTILAIPGALGSIVANAANAIYINTGGVKVTLRNLNVLNLSGTGLYGVRMDQGAELTVENCEFYGLGWGIYSQALNSVVAIKKTVIRNSVEGVFVNAVMKATLDGVHLLNNGYGLHVAQGASAAVGNSVFANNSSAGVYVYAGTTTTSQVLVANSVLNANGYGVWGVTSVGVNAVSIALERSALTGNSIGVYASTTASSTLTVVLDNNALIGNTTAINYLAPAAVFSRGNNTLKLNGTDVSGPALTSLAGQ